MAEPALAVAQSSHPQARYCIYYTVCLDRHPNVRSPATKRRGLRAAASAPVKGRGTVWAIEHRYRASRPTSYDDGWGTLDQQASEERLGPETTVVEEQREVDPLGQRLARSVVRSLDQSLPRLRAWLRLLLRAADAQLSRPLAGPRLRDPDHRQGECGRAIARRAFAARLRAQRDQHRLGDRCLSAGRTQARDHALADRAAVRVRGIRSRWSRSRRASSAISISSRRWPSAAWSRSTSR